MKEVNLTPEQQKLFKKLKKAYSDCEKAGVFFVNNYGSLEGYNSEYVEGYSDKENSHSLAYNQYINSFKIANEWTDDAHFLQLTEKGYLVAKANEQAYKKSIEGFDI